MRQQTPPTTRPAAGPRTLRGRTGWVAAIALLLAACSSVPLPEWPQPASPQAAPAIPAAPASAPADPLAQLERLAQLHERGLLSADEFAAAKAKLLGL